MKWFILEDTTDLTAVRRPWKMYPLGVLFGLGFDTSSEVALLSIASIQGAKGTSIWLILIFPILFTGMLRWIAFRQRFILIDTFSWHVSRGYDRRSSDDGSLHKYLACEGSDRNPLLFNSAHSYHGCGGYCHWHHPGPDPHSKRR